jgi:hypothetical protein
VRRVLRVLSYSDFQSSSLLEQVEYGEITVAEKDQVLIFFWVLFFCYICYIWGPHTLQLAICCKFNLWHRIYN